MATPTRTLSGELLETFDFVWDRLRGRLEGLGDEEYRWEPAPGGWNVRRTADDNWRVDWADPDPEPAPVTTIAWRMWHIGLACLDSYSDRLFAETGTGLVDKEWVGDAASAAERMDAAWSVFRRGVESWGEDGLWRPLGPAWGRWSEHSNLALAFHAIDEIVHHGAEIALLRDLYAARGG
jgi:hypothetical protein